MLRRVILSRRIELRAKAVRDYDVRLPVCLSRRWCEENPAPECGQMASEDHRPSSGGRSASQIDRDAQHIATSIAQKLQEARLRCEIVNLLPVEAAVLRRDRIVVILALTLLTTLAASYMLWLSADMAMGGMNMSGFRMIPSGMGLMIPAEQPWQGMEFVFVFAMWTVMMIGTSVASSANAIQIRK